MIDAHWSRFLGVPASALQRPGVVVTAHAELGDYRGIWFFVRGGGTAVVSAPPEWVARLEHACRSAAPEDLLSPALALRVLGRAAGKIIGPSFQGWLPAERFRRVASESVRLLANADTALLREFRSSCPPLEWELGGIDTAAAETWASFHEAQIAALGQLRARAGGAVDPCIVTLPQQRGRGHALRLVSAMAEQALSTERLVLYQTLLSNAPALAVARRLGFEPYATLLAVRLAPDAG
jgi:GNAT superfamily N-acetyltransferase